MDMMQQINVFVNEGKEIDTQRSEEEEVAADPLNLGQLEDKGYQEEEVDTLPNSPMVPAN